MKKRRTSRMASGRYHSDENPIDIDGAFMPSKGSQSVDYDVDDEQIGLTQAFGPIIPEEEPRYGWNDTHKWNDFDWNASREGSEDVPREQADGADASRKEKTGSHAAIAPEPAEEAPAVAEASATTPSSAPAPAASGSSDPQKRGRHAAPETKGSERMRKSRRTRTVLIVVIVLLVLGLGGLGYYMYQMFTASQQQAAQQTQEQAASAAAKNEIEGDSTADATGTVAKLTDVPNLVGVFGMSKDDAIAAIGRGAVVTSENGILEHGNPIRTNVTISLADEPADPRTGTSPSVFLGLNRAGTVIEVGYSASASALGFGSLSFADAVNGEHAIEKTLQKIGLEIPEGSAVLPEDKNAYSTYASDGTTVIKESSSFTGDASLNGEACTWSSVLSYDYSTQVLTGNLSDTVRTIYSYVSLNVQPDPEDEAELAAKEAAEAEAAAAEAAAAEAAAAEAAAAEAPAAE